MSRAGQTHLNGLEVKGVPRNNNRNHVGSPCNGKDAKW